MMEAARTSETSVDSYFIRQYIPEDKSELHIMLYFVFMGFAVLCIYGFCMVLTVKKTIISLNSINQLIFVMVKYGVLFEVRTEFLNII
jgi:hypothetical protein